MLFHQFRVFPKRKHLWRLCHDLRFLNAHIHGNAQLEPEYDLQRNDARVWYIPHHDIYRLHKRDKMGLCLIAQLCL